MAKKPMNPVPWLVGAAVGGAVLYGVVGAMMGAGKKKLPSIDDGWEPVAPPEPKLPVLGTKTPVVITPNENIGDDVSLKQVNVGEKFWLLTNVPLEEALNLEALNLPMAFDSSIAEQNGDVLIEMVIHKPGNTRIELVHSEEGVVAEYDISAVQPGAAITPAGQGGFAINPQEQEGS